MRFDVCLCTEHTFSRPAARYAKTTHNSSETLCFRHARCTTSASFPRDRFLRSCAKLLLADKNT